MNCIARLNVASNLTLLLHFLPTSQITIPNVSDHRQLCCLLHPIRTAPHAHAYHSARPRACLLATQPPPLAQAASNS